MAYSEEEISTYKKLRPYIIKAIDGLIVFCLSIYVVYFVWYALRNPKLTNTEVLINNWELALLGFLGTIFYFIKTK